jgi:hypothetical protein
MSAWFACLYGDQPGPAGAGSTQQQLQQQTTRWDLGPLGKALAACSATNGHMPGAAAGISSSSVCQVRLAASTVQGLALLHRPWALQVLHSLRHNHQTPSSMPGDMGLPRRPASNAAGIVPAGSSRRAGVILQLAGQRCSNNSSSGRSDPQSIASVQKHPCQAVLLSEVPRLQHMWRQMHQLQQQSARLRQLLQSVVLLQQGVQGVAAGAGPGGSGPTVLEQDNGLACLLLEVSKVQQGLAVLYGSFLLASSLGATLTSA